MNVKQFRCLSDNLGYVIYGPRAAVAVDGGATEKILTFLETENLNLKFVTTTHAHADHTVGIDALLEASEGVYLNYKKLMMKKVIDIDGERIRIYPTPGHTDDSVSFHAGNALLTGDTLFNGTVGNCFSGDLERFFRSIKLILGLPGETVIYAGHDYVMDSMAFAKKLEPDNYHIDAFVAQYDPADVRSTLSHELKINPYLRFNDPKMISILKKRGLPVTTEYARWESLMSIE